MTTTSPETPISRDILDKIEEARRAATVAELEAEDAEREARRKRRHAKNLMNRYERLVQEHMGQLAFMPEETVGQPSGS